MPSSIINLIHSIFTEHYPKLPIELDEIDGDDAILRVDGTFCELEIIHDEDGYQWFLLEGYDPFKWEDEEDSEKFQDEREALDGDKFDPANPAWDPEDMVGYIMHALSRENKSMSHAWYQRRIEVLNAVTEDLAAAEEHTTRKPVEAAPE